MKLREFVTSLDEAERRLLAALLAPGVSLATTPHSPEVGGFAMANPSPAPSLPLALSRALARSQVRVTGLDDDPI